MRKKRTLKKKTILEKVDKSALFISERIGFIPYPPDSIEYGEDKKPAWLIDEGDLVRQNCNLLLALLPKEEAFKESRNPVYAIEAFMLSHKLRVYPPMWVIDFLNAAFEKHYSTFGERTLDEIMGFKKGYQGGHGNAYREILSEARDERIMLDVFRLTICSYKLSQSEASHAVAERLAQTENWDKTGLKLASSKASVIEKEFGKKWNDIYSYEFFKNLTLQWLSKNETEFLKSFPLEALPPRVLAELK